MDGGAKRPRSIGKGKEKNGRRKWNWRKRSLARQSKCEKRRGYENSFLGGRNLFSRKQVLIESIGDLYEEGGRDGGPQERREDGITR